MRHVIWDWNGTLCDDLHVVVDAVSASMALFGEGPITHDIYRDHYARPVHLFYDKMLGRSVTADEWVRIDETFHHAYRNSLDRTSLTEDTWAAVDHAGEAGCTQSILSMWWHDELVPTVNRMGLGDRMVLVDGNRAGGGETKTAHLERHLRALEATVDALDPARVLVVGDSLDDARAAREVRVRCVLYDGGSHHRTELEAAGVPVADTLVEALQLGGVR